MKPEAYRAGRALRKRIQYGLMAWTPPVSPRQMRAARIGPRVFANSIPKAGTNLLRRLLLEFGVLVPTWAYHVDETLTGAHSRVLSCRKGQVVTGHFPWDPDFAKRLDDRSIRKFLIVRDLRDVAVSNMYYIAKMDFRHPLHQFLSEQPSDHERLMFMIRGVEPERWPSGQMPKIWENDSYRKFLDWIDDPKCLLIRFEELVGPRGGGTQEKQRACVWEAAQHLDCSVSASEVSRICDVVFSQRSRTFRKGQIGAWKRHFNEEHKAAFKKSAGDALVKLGYEVDQEW